jgi:hypothetical protein
MTQDLTPNDLPEKLISPALSSGLKSLLVDGDNVARSVQQIAEDPELRAETLAQLPVLRAAAMQKAGHVGVREVIGSRFALYPQPARSEAEWAAWWADYYEALADLSWHALEAGMVAWVQDPASEFLPKPGKLLILARSTPNRISKAYYRATKVAEYQPPKVYETLHPVDPPKVRTVEDATAIKRMAAEAVQALGATVERSRPSQAGLPSIAGKPDEGGLTPAMRELLARRAEG